MATATPPGCGYELLEWDSAGRYHRRNFLWPACTERLQPDESARAGRFHHDRDQRISLTTGGSDARTIKDLRTIQEAVSPRGTVLLSS